MPLLSAEEVAALYAYLRSVPKIVNRVPRKLDSYELTGDVTLGKRLYHKYACVSCHGETGADGQVDLRQAGTRFRTQGELEAWIRDAPSIKPDTRMPPWKDVIGDSEYAPLSAYVLELGKQ